MEKYYGDIYRGNIDVYNFENLHECNSPYEALKIANMKWEANTEDIVRLLIVFRKDESNGKEIEKNRACFQFLDSNSCLKFINLKSNILWSTSEHQVWNGNVNLV